MANRILNRVFKSTLSRGSDRLGLVYLADQANDHAVATPSRERIRVACNLETTRAVTKLIGRLAELGEIYVDHRPGKWSRYVVMAGLTAEEWTEAWIHVLHQPRDLAAPTWEATVGRRTAAERAAERAAEEAAGPPSARTPRPPGPPVPQDGTTPVRQDGGPPSARTGLPINTPKIPKEKNPPTPQDPNGTSRPQVPPVLDDPAFWEAWAGWVAHRREIRKKLTPTAVSRQIASLERMGLARAVAAIDHSIRQGYTGIYEPKEKRPRPAQVRPADESGSQVRSRTGFSL